MKKRIVAEGLINLEQIKKLVIMAMFSDDELMDRLVLKGGHALDLLCKTNLRASVDVDFSMESDFPEKEREDFLIRIKKALEKTFLERGYTAFDFKIELRPPKITPEMETFWGGYRIEFKLIEKDKYAELITNVRELRTHALPMGQGKKFLIDISKHEYTAPKSNMDLEGLRIFVYTPEMMVCEKLRAICQQIPEYGPIVRRSRSSTPRPRDFLDIYTFCTECGVDFMQEKNKILLARIFETKKVPLKFLGLINKYREFHRLGFPSVIATVKVGMEVKEFDFYFDFTLSLVEQLKSFWNE
ncbi:MAG: nucleotidyl transferase AbiEii/AbiGii toxin family protein [Candidatus Aminicenantes bacterium]|nr:nucleotidyl transferase AbiEii/AbiGii toxin family protein [Candidatus Aminicenantes bacterium]